MTGSNQVLFARAIVLLKPSGETDLLEIFVIQRSNPEPPYTPEELYIKLGRIGGQILISEEPITENSKTIINEFYKKWVKGKETPLQKGCRLTDWLTKPDYEKLIKNYTIPFEWKRLQGWVKKT